MEERKGFTILEENEIECKHEWVDETANYTVINPNGEFVKGHGSSLVLVPNELRKRCVRCGLIKPVTN